MPEFPAITHVALTVTSLERSVPWYKDLFGSDPILDEDTGPFQRVAWLTGGTIVGVTQFPDLDSTEPFNERRPGLDHLAFGCANRDELKAWEIRLKELGIPNGSVKATVLIETILAAFEMDEILYEVRDHIVGLNCGRWDYIFSFIKKFRNRPAFVLPDRAQVTMDKAFLGAYVDLSIKT